MRHQGKAVQPGATFLMNDNPSVRYTVEAVYPNKTLEYITETAYLKRRHGSKSRTMPVLVTFREFVSEVFGEWVESVEEQEHAARIIQGEIYALQHEIGGTYDEAVILNALYDARNGKDTGVLLPSVIDIIAINAGVSRKEGYDEGYNEGYDHGYAICLELGPED